MLLLLPYLIHHIRILVELGHKSREHGAATISVETVAELDNAALTDNRLCAAGVLAFRRLDLPGP